MQEEWKDAVGYECYFRISNFGRVFSKRTSKILALTKLKSGYLVLNTRLEGRSGKAISIRVHRMVAQAFLPEPSQELVDAARTTKYGKVIVNHLDGDKTNNNHLNLEWSDHKSNTKHAIEKGLMCSPPSGYDSPNFKLTQDQVEYIKMNFIPYHKEFGARALGRKFNVNHCCITRAYNM